MSITPPNSSEGLLPVHPSVSSKEKIPPGDLKADTIAKSLHLGEPKIPSIPEEWDHFTTVVTKSPFDESSVQLKPSELHQNPVFSASQAMHAPNNSTITEIAVRHLTRESKPSAAAPSLKPHQIIPVDKPIMTSSDKKTHRTPTFSLLSRFVSGIVSLFRHQHPTSSHWRDVKHFFKGKPEELRDLIRKKQEALNESFYGEESDLEALSREALPYFGAMGEKTLDKIENNIPFVKLNRHTNVIVLNHKGLHNIQEQLDQLRLLPPTDANAQMIKELEGVMKDPELSSPNMYPPLPAGECYLLLIPLAQSNKIAAAPKGIESAKPRRIRSIPSKQVKQLVNKTRAIHNKLADLLVDYAKSLGVSIEPKKEKSEKAEQTSGTDSQPLLQASHREIHESRDEEELELENMDEDESSAQVEIRKILDSAKEQKERITHDDTFRKELRDTEETYKRIQEKELRREELTPNPTNPQKRRP